MYKLSLRLRSTSSVEAVQVGKLAGELGVKHQVLAVDWEGPTPVKKIQLQARLKRYEALLKFCEASSLSTLMTAHHLDDQIGKHSSAQLLSIVCFLPCLQKYWCVAELFYSETFE